MKVTYGQAISVMGNRIWCGNCGQNLASLMGKLTSYTEIQTITNVGGITVITDEIDGELHRCEPKP